APADLPSSAGLFRPSLEQPLVNQHLMGDDSASEPALAGPLLTTAHRSPAPTPAAQAPSAPRPSPRPPLHPRRPSPPASHGSGRTRRLPRRRPLRSPARRPQSPRRPP